MTASAAALFSRSSSALCAARCFDSSRRAFAIDSSSPAVRAFAARPSRSWAAGWTSFGLNFCHAARFFGDVVDDARLGRAWGTRRISKSSPSAIEARSNVSSVAPGSAGSRRR
jgi:hypothetical protein